jgi:hypothetical protein
MKRFVSRLLPTAVAVTALWASFVSCDADASFDDLCERILERAPCRGEEGAPCRLVGAKTGDRARLLGCSGGLAEWLACMRAEARCEGSAYMAEACGDVNDFCGGALDPDL